MRNGTPFLSVVLADSTGQVLGVIWHCIESAGIEFGVGNVVEIKAATTDYRGEAQIRIDRIRRREASALQKADCPNLDLDMMRSELTNDSDGNWVSTDPSTAAMLATQKKLDAIVSRHGETKHLVRASSPAPSTDNDRIAELVKKYKKKD